EVQRQLGASIDALIYIEAGIPAGIASGRANVRICLEGGEISPWFEVRMEEARARTPVIFTVRNGQDHGTDIHAKGPKSLMRLSVLGLNESADCKNVRVKIGQFVISPNFVGFVAEVADYQIDVQLPENIQPGKTTLSLQFGDVESAPMTVEIIP